MSRTPKLGEVWTADLVGIQKGTRHYTCIDADPDVWGRYGWSFPMDDSRAKTYLPIDELTPPEANPPERLKAMPWVVVYSDGSLAAWTLSAPPVGVFSARALGAINVLTGEWVDRD